MDHTYPSFDYSAIRSSAFPADEYTTPPRIAGHSSSHDSGSSTPNSAESEWEAPSMNLAQITQENWPSAHVIPALYYNSPPENLSMESFNYAHSFFGTRSFEQVVQPEDPKENTRAFDDIFKQIERHDGSDALMYQPAYEPLHWMLSQDSNQSRFGWPHSQSSSPPFLPLLGLSLGDESLQSASRAQRGFPVIQARHERILHSSPLRRQRRSHGDASAHACSECNCTFRRARDLKRHFRLHTGEKPYQCGGCGEGFVRVDARKRHWTAHPECLAIHQKSA